MRFKLFPTASRVAALLLLSVAGTAAQVLQISGKVTLKQPAGSVMPVEGADVDIYRLDISRKFHATTDARGVYVQAGIPFVGTYAIAVSAPGARPDYRASVRFAQQPVNDFALVPGDGSRLTLEQIKAVAARPTVENEKIVAANETVKRTFNAGNEALAANRLDDAVAQYHEGLAARPDELALLINLSEALRRRGVNRFNDSIKTRDERARAAAKNDWKEAADAALKAVELIRALPVPPDPAQQSAQARNRLAALSIRAGSLRLVATQVDPSRAREAFAAYRELIAAETDPARKTAFVGETLTMLFDAGDYDDVLAEGRKVLAADPNTLVACRTVALALYASGDKTKYQEAADLLQRYVDLAPDTDPFKPSALDSLVFLKNVEGITPRKRR